MTDEEKKPRKPRAPKKKFTVENANAEHFKRIGFDIAWLDKIGEQYQFERFQYLHKFRAFRCYRDGQHVDWLDVNDAALLNGKRRVENILLKHHPLPKKRQVIQYPWR